MAGIGDQAVRAKTGRTWEEWIDALDRAGAAALDHKHIARLVHERFGVGAWWCQMVTVGYEQAKGRRAPRQTADGWVVRSSGSLSLHFSARPARSFLFIHSINCARSCRP